MTIATLSTANIAAEKIPYVTADEAYTLLQTAFTRFITLIEALAPEDWSKPTACTAWNVRDMVAHVPGRGLRQRHQLSGNGPSI
jgi:hypothetical protein